jgi:hypothetical protein
LQIRKEFSIWDENKGQTEGQLLDQMKKIMKELKEGFLTSQQITQIKAQYEEKVRNIMKELKEGFLTSQQITQIKG